MAASAARDSKDDKKEEKKSTAKENKVDMQKVFSDAALSVGYLDYAHGNASGYERFSKAYERDYEKTYTAKEFEKLADDARASITPGDAKEIPKNALAAQYEKVSKLVKEGAMAAIDGNQAAFQRKEAELKTAYAELETKAAAVSAEEKKKVDGFQARIEQAEQKELARITAANHQRAREAYLKDQYRPARIVNEKKSRADHHNEWTSLATAEEEKKKRDEPKKLGEISPLSAADSDAKEGRYFNPHKGYMIHVNQERDKDGKPTGRMKAKPYPAANTFLWGYGGGDSVMLPLVSALLGGKKAYARQYCDQIDGMITLLKPSRNNLVETVDGKKSIKQNAGYVMDKPDPRYLQRAGVPPDLQFYWLEAAFEQVEKVKPPIPFGENGWLDALQQNVNAGPFFSGVGTQAPKGSKLERLAQSIKSGDALQYLKPGQDYTIKNNLRMLRELETKINNHNVKVQNELIEHAQKAEDKAKELTAKSEKETAYLDGLVAKGQAIESDAKAAPPAFKDDEEKRKHYIELGAKAEIKEICEAKAPGEARSFADKVKDAKDNLNGAIKHIADFNMIDYKREAPEGWKECFTPPNDPDVAWRNTQKWATDMAKVPVDEAAVVECKEIAKYLEFCGDELKRSSEAYADACRQWSTSPGYAQYKEHYEFWSHGLKDSGRLARMEDSAPVSIGLYKAETLDRDVKSMREKVERLTKVVDGVTESPVQISAEVAKLSHQVERMKALDGDLQKKLNDFQDRKTVPPGVSVEDHLDAVKREADGIADEIKQLAEDAHATFASYQENKEIWKPESPELKERIRELDTRMMDGKRSPGPADTGGTLFDAERVRAGNTFEIERAYNAERDAVERVKKAAAAAAAAPVDPGDEPAAHSRPRGHGGGT